MFTAKDVMALREMSGAGMMDCKKALTACEGDMDKAMDYLREKSLAASAKKAARIAAEGIVSSYVTDDHKVGAIVEVNCETDFVANTDSYKDFCKKAAQVALEGKNIEETLMDEYKMLLTKTGENVKIRRSERYELTGAGVLSGYIHMGGKIGVLVELACEKADAKVDEAAHMICLQVAANAPKYLAPADVPQAEIDAELEIKLNALKEQKGKLPPEQALVGIKKGMAAKFCTQICLVKQDYVADGEVTVEKYLEGVSKEVGAPITVKRFCRMQLGA